MTKNNDLDKFFDKIQKYRFEFRHLTLLFIILIVFQLLLSYIQKNSLETFLTDAQRWYQKDNAEKIANLTSTSLELLIEGIPAHRKISEDEKNKLIELFDIIFSQQLLDQRVEEICLIVSKNDHVFVIDEGINLYDYIIDHKIPQRSDSAGHSGAFNYFLKHADEIRASQEIFSKMEDGKSFNILVPFVPHGEYIGAFYVKNHPDFSLVTKEIIVSYDEATIIYSSFILLGLLAMYYISSYTVKERDEAQRMLFVEHEENIKKQIRHEKESMFTKRIYHTHHKAEKVMGFIKKDLLLLKKENSEEIRERIKKYSNFISRVIYDMKWYDPPISTFRGDLFRTDINQLIRFLIDNLFLRIAMATELFHFKLELDENVPPVRVNEFVVWEILEPIMQNSIDHSGDRKVSITIKTNYDPLKRITTVEIMDDGPGIKPELLEFDSSGIKKLFREDISTKELQNKNSGYGCYIAHNIAVNRCGWQLDVTNNPDKGCKFIITIKN